MSIKNTINDWSRDWLMPGACLVVIIFISIALYGTYRFAQVCKQAGGTVVGAGDVCIKADVIELDKDAAEIILEQQEQLDK